MKLRFGECSFDTDAHVLLRSTDEVHLSPKAYELLRLLLEHRPNAVSKTDLVQRIWPGVFVSDSSVTRLVSEVRTAIGDRRGETCLIRTLHRFGYAFVAAVEQQTHAAESSPAPPPRCWLICGSLEFPLRDGEHIAGRTPAASVRLDSPRVSRRHTRFDVSGAHAMIEDLGSKNGTFVNEKPVVTPTPLAPGDAVRIGPFTLIFRALAGSESTDTEMHYKLKRRRTRKHLKRWASESGEDSDP
jgi:DNA-binding winged helix-turn-helix (wHTH) protein